MDACSAKTPRRFGVAGFWHYNTVIMLFSHEKIRKLKKWWLTIAFVGGVFLDVILLGRVDQLFGMVLLFVHMINAGGNLLLLYGAIAGRFSDGVNVLILRFSPLFIQFSFGALLSGTLIFYGQSGSWSTSWPFLLLVLGVMIGNELVHNRAQRLILNLSIFFLGIFSYLVLFIPIFLKKMGPWIFVGSGILALIVIVIYVRIVRLIVPKFIELHQRMIVFSLGMIFVTLNFLYFGNIIPPIPLSLKHIDIYHNVVKVEGGYRLTYEEAPWYKFWRDADTTIRRAEGKPVYCFASVFAPTKFSLTVVHVWEVYDETLGAWKAHARIPYGISGGSEKGYRGYTYIENTRDGTWRCTVETERGQVLGRETFTVVTGAPQKNMVTVVE